MKSSHLLPSNANSYEKALSLTAQFGDDILPEDIKTLWRPQEVAARFLPFMAWGLHVDFWRDSLPETAKRNLISGSYEWHRIEGTFGAIRRICEAVFGQTQVQAWYDYGGDPYGFKVVTEGRMSTPDEWIALREAIWFAQALRDSLDGIEVHRNLKMQLYHGIARASGGYKQIGLPEPNPRTAAIYTGTALSQGGLKRIGLRQRNKGKTELSKGTIIIKTGIKTIGASRTSLELLKGGEFYERYLRHEYNG